MSAASDDRHPPSLPVAPPDRGRTATRLAFLALAAIMVALLKPWDLVAAPASVSPPNALAPPLPSPDLATPTPRPGSAGGVSCEVPDGWRLVTVQRVDGRLVVTWSVIQPVVAGGPPADRSPLELSGGGVVAVGVCAPGARSADVEVAGLWQLTGSVLTTRSAEPAHDLPSAPVSDPARLVLPADASSPAAWSPGRYVLGIRYPAGATGPLFYVAVDLLGP